MIRPGTATLRLLSAGALAAALACGSQASGTHAGATAGTVANGTTGATTGNASQANDTNVASEEPTPGAVGSDAAYLGPVALQPEGASSLCLTSTSDTPAVGDGLHLAACAGGVNQQFVSRQGHLRSTNGLCLANLGAHQAAPADVSAAAGSPNFTPQLLACEANLTVVQHVEPWFGTLSNMSVPDAFGLSAGQVPSVGAQLLWVARDVNQVAQQWRITSADATLAGRDVDAAGVQLLYGSDANRCLDANFVAPGDADTTVGVRACDAQAVSQRWRYVKGTLRGGGGCLDGNGGILHAASCQTGALLQWWAAGGGALVLGPGNLCLDAQASDAGQATAINCGLATGWQWGGRPTN